MNFRLLFKLRLNFAQFYLSPPWLDFEVNIYEAATWSSPRKYLKYKRYEGGVFRSAFKRLLFRCRLSKLSPICPNVIFSCCESLNCHGSNENLGPLVFFSYSKIWSTNKNFTPLSPRLVNFTTLTLTAIGAFNQTRCGFPRISNGTPSQS